MSIRIRHASNGFIVERENDDESGGTTIEVVQADGYSEPNPDVKQLEGMQQLLYTVMEWAGYYGSKHHQYRLRIIVEDQQAESSLVGWIKDAQE